MAINVLAELEKLLENPSLEFHLTPRERGVVNLAALGFSQYEISERLGTTREAVGQIVFNVKRKTGIGMLEWPRYLIGRMQMVIRESRQEEQNVPAT